jgi:VCBS repeat-containing protein
MGESFMARFIFGSWGNDTIYGSDHGEFIFSFSGNDTIYAGGGDDVVFAGRGRDFVDGGEGDDLIFAGRGNDTVIGGEGEDIVFGGRGADIIYGGQDQDILFGNRGSDFLDGGEGGDLVFGGRGNDTLAFTYSENTYLDDDDHDDNDDDDHDEDDHDEDDHDDDNDDHDDDDHDEDHDDDDDDDDDAEIDYYDGGRGIDTLVLNFTASEWADPAIQQEILDYLDFIAVHTGPNGRAHGEFEFETLNLVASNFELVEVYVDGVLTDPNGGGGTPVTAADDAFSVGEDNDLSGNVGLNDTPTTGVTFTLISGVTNGVLTLNGDGTFSFLTNGAFEGLDDGDTAIETFTYQVSDGATTATATVTITIQGANDAPVVAAVSQSFLEDDPIIVDLLSTASDVDAGDILGANNVIQTGGTAITFSVVNGVLTVDNASLQYLPLGIAEVFTFSFDVSDGTATVTNTLTLTIMGENDAPAVGAALTGATNEDDASFTLDLLNGASDVDAGAVLSVTNVSALPAGVSLVGSILTVDPSDASFQSLNLGDTTVITITYDVTDENGASVAQTATITLTGTNDTPIVAAALTAAANEDDASFDIDLLTGASDVDAGAVLSIINVSALPAGVSLVGNVLTVDPSDASFQSLNVGQSVDLLISYDITDEFGATVPQTATITLTGTNDTPIVAAALTAAANEDDANFDIDLLSGASDVDNGAVLSITNVSALPSGVTLIGSTLTIDPSDGSLQSLALGETVDLIISYDVIDENGASVAQTATITITGTNDAPTVAAALTAAANEDDPSFDIDLLSGASDVDNGAVLSITNVSALPSGFTLSGSTLTVDPSDPSLQSLNLGETFTLFVGYSVVDENGASVPQSLAVTFTGTNDTPTVDAALTAAATEDNAVFNLNLLFGASDVDTGATLSVINLSPLPAGITVIGSILTIDPSDASFQSLNLGQTVDLVITYDVTDEHGASVPQSMTITVTGTNDAPTVAAALSVAALEDDASFTLDLLTGASDVDNGAVLSVANVSALPSGVTLSGNILTIDPSDSSFQSLNLGVTSVITVTYDVIDENGATVAQTATITITGTNDAPVVAAALTASAFEDDASFTLDLLAGVTDVDNGASLGIINVSTLPAGVTRSGTIVTVDPAHSAFQSLNLGETLDIIITYDVTDENGALVPQTATITITGTNDTPTVTGDFATTRAEDSASFDIDLLSRASDVDNGAVLSITNVSTLPDGITLTGSILSVDPSDASFQSLAIGQSVVLVVNFDVTDEHGASVASSATITITGTNDAPTVAAAIAAAAFEDDAGFSLDMLAGAADVDNGAVLSVANVSILTPGASVSGSTIFVNPSDASFQSLNVGETAIIAVTYDVVDEFGASVAQSAIITITGTNDVPTVSAAITAAANEDDASFTLDLLTGASDVDNGAVLSITNVSALPAGVTLVGSTLTVDPSDGSLQSLALGETVDLIISYDVTDENGATVPQTATITITGTNDAPTVAAALTAAANEDDPSFTLDLITGASDVDNGAVLSITNVAALPAGVSLISNILTIDPSDASFQSLNVGQTLDLVVTYDVTDEFGATIAQTATITITGTNDAPVVSATIAATTSEDDAPITVDLLQNASDIDAGAVLSVANIQQTAGRLLPAPTLSGNNLVFDSSGFQDLDDGESEIITFTYDVVDENGAVVSTSVSITVTGVNDAPVATAILITTNEDAAPSDVDLLSTAFDVDASDVLSVQNIVQTAGRPVTLVVSGTTLTFDPAAFQDLDTGENEIVTFTYDITDGDVTITNTATFTVEGRNDAPTASLISITTDEDAVAASVVDLLSTAADVDTNDVLSVLNITQTSGRPVTPMIVGSTLTFDPSGFQDLALGETETVSFTYDITDGDATISNTVSFIVEGRNDAPVVSAPVVGLQVATFASNFSYTVPAGTITDIDASDVLTWTATLGDGSPLPAWLSFDPLTQTFSGSPGPADAGIVRIEVTATDPHGASASNAFWLASVDNIVMGTPNRDNLLFLGNSAEIVYSLESNDQISMGDGSDIYVYNAGDGFDVIEDNGFADTDIVFIEGYNPADATLSLWANDADDLRIEFGNGDTILIRNTLNGSTQDQIEQIIWEDGTVWTMQNVRDMLIAQSQTAGNDTVTGFFNDDTLEAGTGNDYMVGGDGSDTYIYNAGDGRDIIEDNGFADNDVVEIRGYSSTDATITQVPGDSDDILIRFSATDSILIRNTLLNGAQDAIEAIVFTGDGVTLSMADLRLQLIANQQTAGDDNIVGFSVNPNEVFEGGLGNDFIQGRDGADTYIFNMGDGVDVIEDNGFADTDILDIRGYSSTDASFSVDPVNNISLIISFANGDNITLLNTLNGSSQDQIEQITFDGDAAVLTMADIRAILLTQQQTAGDDSVQGYSFDEIFEAGTGNDFVSGGDGSDTYIFNLGDGQDVIEDNGFADTDVLDIRGYSSTDATISLIPGDGDDIVISFASGDSIIIRNTLFESSQDGIEQIIFDGDSVTLSMADIRLQLIANQQTAGNDDIIGFGNFDEVFEGGLGNDFIEGRDGSDTYIFNMGDGVDVIEDNGFGDTDIVDIRGYSSTDASFSVDPSNNNSLIISFANGDSITLRNTLNGSSLDQIEQITFDGDAAVLTMTDIRALLISQSQTSGNDSFTGWNFDTTYEGGLGNDTITAGNGDDTFIFNAGDGRDVYFNFSSGGTDSLIINGYSSTDVTLIQSPSSANGTILQFGNGDQIILVDDRYIENITFNGDGISWTQAQLQAEILLNGTNLTVVSGSNGVNDILVSTALDESLEGGTGSDIYQYAAGGGSDYILDVNDFTFTDRLEITGYSSTNVSFEVTGETTNLLMDFGGGDMIVIIGFLANPGGSNSIDEFFFAGDGITLTSADILNLLITNQQTTGNDIVTGYRGFDILEAGLGDDYMFGGDGSDTYIFNLGDGRDVIEDNGSADNDLLDIRGYSSTDASFSYAPGNSATLIISFVGGDRITIVNTLNNSFQDQIELISFDGDGVTFTMADINALLLAQQQTAGDDVVNGSPLADTIEAGLGNDFIFGGNGSDTYVFNAGDGDDIIEDNGSADNDILDIRGYSSTQATFALLPGDVDDLLITFASGDSIIIRNTLNQSFTDAIELITFDGDSTSFNMADIRAILISQQQSTGDDNITGFALNDIIEGGLGDDYMTGGNGSDTYIFNAGDGRDVIYDSGSADNDLLDIRGYSSTDASFSYGAGSTNDLVISFISGDRIIIRDTINSSFANQIEQISFDGDGISFNMADIRAILFAQQQTPGDDVINGSTLADTLEGGLGNDFLFGGNGSDTYVYTLGDGADAINDNGAGSTDVLQLSGMLSTEITLSRNEGAPNDLLLTFSDGGSVYIYDTLSASFSDQIEEIQFLDDSVTWTMADVRAMLLAQESTNGDDRLSGWTTNDILEAGLGDDFMSGGNGSDTYIFNMGDGSDLIQDSGAGSTDVVQFADYASTDATFERLTLTSNDLLITFTNGDQIIIVNGAANTFADGIEQFQFTDTTLSIADVLAGL